ncbi:MAG: hypothetical protein HWN66_02025 [Candidatus Helarchaeota archaeon]|nr:hypothetical protein [Candidatus Helarchaeota archaeon]
MPFKEDDAVEIAYSAPEAEKFDNKYPNCVVDVIKMKPKDTLAFLTKHPKADVGKDKKGEPPKNLWSVEFAELGKEKLIVILSPITKTVVHIETEKLEPEPEEKEEEEKE